MLKYLIIALVLILSLSLFAYSQEPFELKFILETTDIQNQGVFQVRANMGVRDLGRLILSMFDSNSKYEITIRQVQ